MGEAGLEDRQDNVRKTILPVANLSRRKLRSSSSSTNCIWQIWPLKSAVSRWDILKRERYYGRCFTSKQELVQMIGHYIRYYNTRRVQRNLGVLTPMEKHMVSLAA